MISLLLLVISWILEIFNLINQWNEVSNFLYLLAEKETEIHILKDIIEGKDLEIKDLKDELEEWLVVYKELTKNS